MEHTKEKNMNEFQKVKSALISTGVYTVDDLVQVWNCDPDDVRNFLLSSEKNGHLFTVNDHEGNMVVPKFFFDRRNCLIVEIGALLRPMRESGLSSWRQWAWLITMNTEIGGRPVVSVTRKSSQRETVQAAYSVGKKRTQKVLVMA